MIARSRFEFLVVQQLFTYFCVLVICSFVVCLFLVLVWITFLFFNINDNLNINCIGQTHRDSYIIIEGQTESYKSIQDGTRPHYTVGYHASSNKPIQNHTSPCIQDHTELYKTMKESTRLCRSTKHHKDQNKPIRSNEDHTVAYQYRIIQ